MSQTGKHIRKEECNYHYGKGVTNKGEYTIVYAFKTSQYFKVFTIQLTPSDHCSVPGGVETRYSCCEGVMGAPGCQVFKVGKGIDGLLHNMILS